FLGHARRALPYGATITVLWVAAVSYTAAALLGWQSWEAVLVPAVLALVSAFVCWRYGRRLQPVQAWGVCAATCVAFILFPARDLGYGYAMRHSPSTIVRMIRHWPASRKSPVVSVQRQWHSASFYLHREVAGLYGEHLPRELVTLINQKPEVLVLVEN